MTHMSQTIKPEMPELEHECVECDGDGGKMFRCEPCGGTGQVLTQEGYKLLDFIRRHIRSDAKVR